YVCSTYNDTFITLLDSEIKLDPKFSKNISFDSKGNTINVNSGFFEVCTPGNKKVGSQQLDFPCVKGRDELLGTGFDGTDYSGSKQGGATSWLETKASVKPGEIITVQFMIWDTGDHGYDSTVLLDNWNWDAKPTTTTEPVTDRPK